MAEEPLVLDSSVRGRRVTRKPPAWGPKSPETVATAPVKRGPGRPRKNLNSDLTATSKTIPTTTIKRGPGRPKKTASPTGPSTAKPPKRGPGRPKKTDSPTDSHKATPKAADKRGPGRPPKNPKADIPLKSIESP